MADTSGTIGSGGDYTDVADWESSIDVSTDPCIGSMLDGYEETSNININGYSPTATNYIELTADSEAEHNGTAHEVSALGNCRCTGPDDANAYLRVQDAYTHVSWLEIYANKSAGYDGITVGSGASGINYIHHNVIHNNNNSSSLTNRGIYGIYANQDLILYRNIIYGFGGAGIHIGSSSTSSRVYYNTSCLNVRGIRNDVASIEIKYNSVFGNTTIDLYSTTGTYDYNWSVDSYVLGKNGANGEGGKTITDELIDPTSTWADSNFLLKSGASTIDEGVDESAQGWDGIDESIDNRGTSISGIWDIGAGEYVASGGVSITPLTITTGESVGTPTVSIDGVEIVPLSIASAEAVGTPTITQGTEISPLSIASSESVGVPNISVGGVSISPLSIVTGESVGTPTISVGGVDVAPLSISSSEFVGTPSISLGGVEIVPISIVSGEAVGAPVITVGGTIITPLTIPTSEAVGTPSVSVGGVEIVPLSISSSESVGNPTITQGETITPITIVSGEVVNNPSISVGGVEIVPTSISSSEFVGLPSISVEGIEIVPVTIPTSETVNNPTISVGSVYIVPITIASSEALGTPTITGGTPSEDFVNIITGNARINQIITGSARIHQVITGKARISV